PRPSVELAVNALHRHVACRPFHVACGGEHLASARALEIPVELLGNRQAAQSALRRVIRLRRERDLERSRCACRHARLFSGRPYVSQGPTQTSDAVRASGGPGLPGPQDAGRCIEFKHTTAPISWKTRGTEACSAAHETDAPQSSPSGGET